MHTHTHTPSLAQVISRAQTLCDTHIRRYVRDKDTLYHPKTLQTYMEEHYTTVRARLRNDFFGDDKEQEQRFVQNFGLMLFVFQCMYILYIYIIYIYIYLRGGVCIHRFVYDAPTSGQVLTEWQVSKLDMTSQEHIVLFIATTLSNFTFLSRQSFIHTRFRWASRCGKMTF